MVIRTIVFLVINFTALALGGIFTGKGVPSDWYQNLNKAPWTPPGWVFGAAWTLIMLCYSPFMAKLTLGSNQLKTIVLLFSLQFLLNVIWNPVFFYFQNVKVGLLIISSLTVLVAYFLLGFMKEVKLYSWLVLPYFLWLLIATSLNAYILMKN